MAQLTQEELLELERITLLSLEEFKAAYRADPLNSPAVQYYEYLANKGFQYGVAALGVVRNDTASGIVANAYTKEVAETFIPNIDFSIGGDNWLKIRV